MADVNKGIGTHLEPMWMGGFQGIGAAATRHGSYTFASAASGTVTYVARIPAGSLITRLFYKSADMGTNVTIDIGMIEGSTTTANKFANDVDVATAAVAMTMADFTPFMVTSDTDIIVTTAGAGTATGRLDILIDSIFFGTGHITKFSY